MKKETALRRAKTRARSVNKQMREIFIEGGVLNPFMWFEPKNRMKEAYDYISGREGIAELVAAAQVEFKYRNGREAETFLDLGSGKGGALIVAAMLGLEATGVEYNDELIALAKRVTTQKVLPKGLPKMRTIQGDILQWTPDKDYDIVYFYHPLRDSVAWGRFRQHVVRTFKEGQLIAALHDPKLGLGYESVRSVGNIYTNDLSVINRSSHIPCEYKTPGGALRAGVGVRINGAEIDEFIQCQDKNVIFKAIGEDKKPAGVYKTAEPPVFDVDKWEFNAPLIKMD